MIETHKSSWPCFGWIIKTVVVLCWCAVVMVSATGCRKPGVAELTTRLEHPSWWMRTGAARALGRTRDERAFVPLTGALKDKNSRVRISAVEALCHLGDVRAIWPLIHLVAEEKDAQVLEAATLAILRVGPEPMSPKLIELLRKRLMWRTPEGDSDPSEHVPDRPDSRWNGFFLFSQLAGISMTQTGDLFELEDLGREDGVDKLFGASTMQVLCRTILLSRPKEPIAVYFTPRAIVTRLKDLIEAQAELSNADKALLFHVKNGNLAGVRQAIEDGADVKADYAASTPLHVAAGRDSEEVVRYLVSVGADLEAMNSIELSPLLFAIMWGTRKNAIALIETGADVDAAAPRGGKARPIHLAVFDNDIDHLRVLLDHGADIDAQRRSGWTALHDAADDDNLAIPKLLIERGARADIRNADGQTPLDVAGPKCKSLLSKLAQRKGPAGQLPKQGSRGEKGHE